jgi:hypothetical protein
MDSKNFDDALRHGIYARWHADGSYYSYADIEAQWAQEAWDRFCKEPK